MKILESSTHLDKDGRTWLVEREDDGLLLSYVDSPIINNDSEYESFFIEGEGFEFFWQLRTVILNHTTLGLLKKFKVDGFETNFNLISYN